MSSYGALADWYDSLTEDVDYEGVYDYLMAILRRALLEPGIHLTRPKFLLAHLPQRRLQLGKIHGFDVLFHICFLILHIKKPS